jgi:type I restriction enzyme S subunit
MGFSPIDNMNSFLTEHMSIWTTAQELKTSNRGRSASNQSLLGIKKLRELILELAVRGKLVPQDPNDEPASELLKKIEAEKRKLIKEGKIKKQEVLPEVGDDEKTFDLPKGWEWVRLQQIIQISSGDGLIAANMNSDGTVPVFGGNGINGYHDKANLDKPTLVIGRVGFYCGSIHITPQSAWVTDNAFITTFSEENIYINFLYWLLKGTNLKENESATAQPVISGRKVYPIVVGLPPLSEQHRIVAKVDELMALCDELENQQTDSNIAHETLVASLLGSLTNAENSNSFDKSWQRISNHFDTLFTTEHSIDQLKQTILQLAVMGKLTQQNPNDKPARELLKKIAKEKAQLVKEGKIKKQNPLPEISDDEKPFELPKGWEFAKMDAICTLITDGTHLTPHYTESGRAFISAQNIKPFKFIPEKHRWVSEEDYQGYIQNRKPELGDILLTRVGAGIGEAAVIDTNLDFAIYVSVGLLKFNKENFFSNYLVVWLNSPLGRNHSEKNTYGKGVSQGNLNLSLIRNFPVSIPPLAEQHRIVSKVDELFALCDALKDRLVEAQTLQNQIAVAVVEQALNKKQAGKEFYPFNEQISMAAEPE